MDVALHATATELRRWRDAAANHSGCAVLQSCTAFDTLQELLKFASLSIGHVRLVTA